MTYIENMYLKWLEFKNYGLSFKDFFEKLEVEAVALYACREPAFVMVHDMLNDGVNIKYIIDMNPKYTSYMGIPVLKLSDIKSLDDVDMIVITLENERHIIKTKYALSPKTNAEICTIKSVIETIYYCGIFLPRVQKLTAELGAQCIHTLTPVVHVYKNLSRREKLLGYTGFEVFERGVVNEDITLPIFDDMENVTEQYIVGCLTAGLPAFWYKSYANKAVNLNRSDEYFNVINNFRIVADSPEKYDNKIFILGVCYATGSHTEDKLTFASRLQGLLNEKGLNGKAYKVENYAVHFNNLDTFEDIVSGFDVSEGDYIIVLDRVEDYLSEKLYLYAQKTIEGLDRIKYYDMTELFRRPHDFGEVYLDFAHMGHKGYKAIADDMYTFMNDNPFEELSIKPTARQRPKAALHNKANNEDEILSDKEFAGYISELNELKQQNRLESQADAKIGAIVVNCNPFTFGHRYIICEAKKQVDILYVFVVEEDRSVFPFTDRIALVREGVKDIDGVFVLPSGKFIISGITFPDYFTKDMISPTIDTSLDATVFAKYIAPALGITVRFAGNEPFCKVTNAYNLSMKEILPKYNIKFVELERVKNGDTAISASEVRRLLETGDFERIKKLVPPATFLYLKDFGK